MTYPAHFTLAEFLHSDTALAQGIDNTPTWEVVENLKLLGGVMERIRAAACEPVSITSGYRGPELNRAIGGAEDSAHLYGLACDFVIPGYGSPLEICRKLEPHVVMLGIDQLIWEYGDWIHLGLSSSTPRYQCLTINNSGTSEGFP
jgi:zinc D-Ala-D-Ala carboxypeptidase